MNDCGGDSGGVGEAAVGVCASVRAFDTGRETLERTVVEAEVAKQPKELRLCAVRFGATDRNTELKQSSSYHH